MSRIVQGVMRMVMAASSGWELIIYPANKAGSDLSWASSSSSCSSSSSSSCLNSHQYRL